VNRTFEYDVFLSYSSKDEEIVRALAERLRKDGLRVWLDKWEIKPGDMIGLKIQHGLEKSRTLVMCMSPAYFGSEWGTAEHQTLLFRDPTNAHRRFIPLLIEDCNRPDIIAQFAYIDWRMPTDDSYDSLLSACQEKMTEEAKPMAHETPVAQTRNDMKARTDKAGKPSDSELFDKQQQQGYLMHPIMVKIQSKGYWKVVIRPSIFEKERIELSDCKTLVRDNRIRLRGWAYPHYDLRIEPSSGLDYVEQFSDWESQTEGWRIYQSGQFIHYMALWEDWEDLIPESRILSVISTVYSLTEIYEFASRLAAKGVLGDSCEIQITLCNTMNRRLATLDPHRPLIYQFKTMLSEIPLPPASLKTVDLIGRSAELSLKQVVWLFQRFNWLDVQVDIFKEDQRKLLEGRILGPA
jgi:hypothetical protein